MAYTDEWIDQPVCLTAVTKASHRGNPINIWQNTEWNRFSTAIRDTFLTLEPIMSVPAQKLSINFCRLQNKFKLHCLTSTPFTFFYHTLIFATRKLMWAGALVACSSPYIRCSQSLLPNKQHCVCWALFSKPTSQISPRANETETWEWDQHLSFNKPSGWFWCTLKCFTSPVPNLVLGTWIWMNLVGAPSVCLEGPYIRQCKCLAKSHLPSSFLI